MTDWPYPRPTPTGFSVLGNPSVFDLHDTVISQYANSPRLVQLIADFAADVDPTTTLQSFYDLVMNLDTAEGYGLDVWGRIVGINRVFQVANSDYFGFAEAGDAQPFGDARFNGYTDAFGFSEAGDASSFGEAPFGTHPIWLGIDPTVTGGAFYAGGSITSNYAASDLLYRQLIYAKAAANITSGSIPAINGLLLSLFPGRGNCYVQEGASQTFFGFNESGDADPFGQSAFYAGQNLTTMMIAYVFTFPLTPLDRAIVAQSGVLPTPVGRSVTIVAPSS